MPRRPAATVALLLLAAPALGQPSDRPPLPGDSRRPDGGLFPADDDRPPPPPPWQRRPRLDRPSAFRPDDAAPQYSVRWTTPQPVDRQPTTLGSIRQEFATPIPVLRDADDLFLLGLRVRNVSFQTRAVLPDSGRVFPRQLWDLTTGFTYVRQLDRDVSAGVLVRGGSASDQPFAGTKEMYVGGAAFVRFPAAVEPDYWQLSLSYFPTAVLPYPIPGVVYEFNPDPDFRLGVGVPFSLFWRPLPRLTFDANYLPLTQVTTRLTLDPRPGFRVFAGFDWQSDGYFLTNRPERRDLFIVDEKRVLGGVRFTAVGRVTLDLSGGWAFDRRFGMGRSAVDLRYDRVNAAGGGFLAGAVLVFF
jgi:hypothetical protein